MQKGNFRDQHVTCPQWLYHLPCEKKLTRRWLPKSDNLCTGHRVFLNDKGIQISIDSKGCWRGNVFVEKQ
jgi:hypothetical protein